MPKEELQYTPEVRRAEEKLQAAKDHLKKVERDFEEKYLYEEKVNAAYAKVTNFEKLHNLESTAVSRKERKGESLTKHEEEYLTLIDAWVDLYQTQKQMKKEHLSGARDNIKKLEEELEGLKKKEESLSNWDNFEYNESLDNLFLINGSPPVPSMKGIALKSYLYSLKDKDPNQPLVYEGIESAHHLYREMNKTPVGTEVTVIYGKENTAHRVSEK